MVLAMHGLQSRRFTKLLARTGLERLSRSYWQVQGMRALQQGANDWSAHHYVFPNPDLLAKLVRGERQSACTPCCQALHALLLIKRRCRTCHRYVS